MIHSLLMFSLGLGLSLMNFTTDKEEFKAVVIDSKDNYYLVQSFNEKFYVSEKNNTKEIGDWLTIKGEQEKLSFSTLESEFNFETYLNNPLAVDTSLLQQASVNNISEYIRISAIPEALREVADVNKLKAITSGFLAYKNESSISFFTFAFVGLEVITGILSAICLAFVNIEKTISRKHLVLIEREKERFAKEGKEWLPADERNAIEIRNQEIEAEEIFTDIVRQDVSSYRQLPLMIYQITDI